MSAQVSSREQLVQELVEIYVAGKEMPLAKKFRATHADQLDDLYQLQGTQRLQIDNQERYKVSLRDVRHSRFWNQEKAIANRVLDRLRDLYNQSLEDPTKSSVNEDAAQPTYHPQLLNPTRGEVRRALDYLEQANLVNSTRDQRGNYQWITPNEAVIQYKDIEEKLLKDDENQKKYSAGSAGMSSLVMNPGLPVKSGDDSAPAKGIDELWKQIHSKLSVSKVGFARRIFFVGDGEREAILRDVAHAYGCLQMTYFKPAVILAGGVVEELLRQYLAYNDCPVNGTFEKIIDACKEKSLVKSEAATNLSHAVRCYRNFAHLDRESSDGYSIDRSTAEMAIHALFTLSKTFKRK